MSHSSESTKIKRGFLAFWPRSHPPDPPHNKGFITGSLDAQLGALSATAKLDRGSGSRFNCNLICYFSMLWDTEYFHIYVAESPVGDRSC